MIEPHRIAGKVTRQAAVAYQFHFASIDAFDSRILIGDLPGGGKDQLDHPAHVRVVYRLRLVAWFVIVLGQTGRVVDEGDVFGLKASLV
jgi:hypothetical protein